MDDPVGVPVTETLPASPLNTGCDTTPVGVPETETDPLEPEKVGCETEPAGVYVADAEFLYAKSPREVESTRPRSAPVLFPLNVTLLICGLFVRSE